MIVRGCIRCGADVVPPASRCERCLNLQRRVRRHPGYDDPRYRRHRKGVRSRVCQRCRLTNAETVHHVDGDPGNNAKGNLMDACGPCAQQLDREMRAARRGQRV